MKTDQSFLQGQRAFLRGEYVRSIISFGNALEAGMDAAKVHVPLGLAYFKNSDFQAAIGEFSLALELEPANDHLLFLRGMALFNDNQLESALDDFSQTLWFNPRRGGAFIARSLVFRSLGRNEDAARDMQSALAAGGVEAELFIREYCLTPHLYTLALTLFDVERAPWGREMREAITATTH